MKVTIGKDLKASFAQIDITPPVGVPLAGGLRARKSEGVDDPLYVRAFVLSDGNKYAVLVTLDLIVICREHVEEACNLIRKKTGISRESILVCASHTHSGPYTAELLDPVVKPDSSYMMKVCEHMAEAVNEAYEKLEPAKIGFASTTVRGLMHNRRFVNNKGSVWNSWLIPPEKSKEFRPSGPIDEELLVLAVKGLDDNLRAVVFNYPLHANTHFGKRISADYPGLVAKLISEKLGPNVVTLFTPGACGDINIGGGGDTSLVGGKIDMNVVAGAITTGILSVMNKIEYVGKCRIDFLFKEIVLPLRDFSRFQEEEISRKWPSGLEVFRKEHEYLSKLKEKEIKSVIHALGIKDAAFIGVPGEFFVELGLGIKAHSPYRYNFVTELANDYVGYIPTIKAFDQGGYETFNARSSKVAAGSGEKIVQETLSMLKMLSL